MRPRLSALNVLRGRTATYDYRGCSRVLSSCSFPWFDRSDHNAGSLFTASPNFLNPELQPPLLPSGSFSDPWVQCKSPKTCSLSKKRSWPKLEQPIFDPCLLVFGSFCPPPRRKKIRSPFGHHPATGWTGISFIKKRKKRRRGFPPEAQTTA